MRDERDSAAGVPKGVVVGDSFDWGNERRPDVPWRKTVIYEAHVKGLTMRHPASSSSATASRCCNAGASSRANTSGTRSTRT